jgi:hypothetical protein
MYDVQFGGIKTSDWDGEQAQVKKARISYHFET